MITTVIAIAESITSYTPILDGTGVSMDRLLDICDKLKKICPEYIYTVVSGGTYDDCNIQAHVNDYLWE